MLSLISKHVLTLSDVSLTSFVRGISSNRTRTPFNKQRYKHSQERRPIRSETNEIDLDADFEDNVDNTNESNNEDISKFEALTVENQHEQLAGCISPLRSMPYSEQLKVKFSRHATALKEFQYMLGSNIGLMQQNNKIKCHLHPVVPSTITEAYRNADAFHVYVGIDRKPKTVGFFVGSFRNFTARCVGPDSSVITRELHKRVAKHFQNFIRRSSLSSHDRSRQDRGYWREINVRSNERGELMATVVMHPQSLSQDQIDKVKAQISKYFQSLDDCKITSMYFQACRFKQCSNVEAPFQLLFGEKYICEDIDGLKLQIFPDSIFPPNTHGAKILYKTVASLCEVNDRSVILDVSSGIGALCLKLAPHARNVFGVETYLHNVENARTNAEINNITNVKFYPGNADLIVPTLSSLFDSQNVTAILDSSQYGGTSVSNSVIDALRLCKEVNKIIFITSKPAGASLYSFLRLCVPKSAKVPGVPFMPCVAVPVDMCPHTNISELIVVFQRTEEVERKKKKRRTSNAIFSKQM